MDRRNFGSDESGGFNEITKQYKADPSIENYVRLRRANPSAEIEVRAVGSFESMFYMRDELERHGTQIFSVAFWMPIRTR
ncbi:hypothetical protein [Chelatococcus composti]|jgi:hypothetical protein|uniref:Uncharacterized protein n=1 Tax=Chelatococcus composti TaxID=1743235 RepID=A0A841K6A2_9HYPH|nr:hypothetical protein [Chelatococcus composti]MBB6167580.1 hypothetical protein [Chelatococcus composti]MBS7735784.1 hypothetical protein [Chelatococcus composti]GGG32949.1 hypothetical protein GCM10008026_11990 [Chelatococcus composti]